MGTEIGARNFADTYRYNMLPVSCFQCIFINKLSEISGLKRAFVF